MKLRAVVSPCCAAVLALPLSAQVTFDHDSGKQLVAADAAIERLATGHAFTEGPVWDVRNQRLVYSDIPVQKWFAWTERTGRTELGASAGANGNTLDGDLRLVSCRHDARDVIRTELDGKQTVLVGSHDGKALNSPNDVVVHRDGSLWFTDPTYGLGKREKEQAGNFVYRFDPASQALTVVQRDFDMPNGLCFSPDGRTLWIADSGKKQRIGAFPVRDDGTLGEPVRWLDGGADGMRCDERGNLWAAARDGVRVFAPTGERGTGGPGGSDVSQQGPSNGGQGGIGGNGVNGANGGTGGNGGASGQSTGGQGGAGGNATGTPQGTGGLGGPGGAGGTAGVAGANGTPSPV